LLSGGGEKSRPGNYTTTVSTRHAYANVFINLVVFYTSAYSVYGPDRLKRGMYEEDISIGVNSRAIEADGVRFKVGVMGSWLELLLESVL